MRHTPMLGIALHVMTIHRVMRPLIVVAHLVVAHARVVAHALMVPYMLMEQKRPWSISRARGYIVDRWQKMTGRH